MLQKKWDLSKIEDRIQLRAIERRRPLSCVWELTYHCNFHCRMCYVRMTDAQAAPFGRLRTVDEWLDMAGQIYNAGVLYLTLTGGECTSYPGFERLYEELARMGFKLTIMSNAAAWPDGVKDLFRRYPPQSVAVTLYGGCNETYEAVTGDPRGFERAVENIRFLQSIGVRIVLNFTAIRQNVLDLPLVGKVSRELGLPYTLITDIVGHQKDPSFSEALSLRLSPAQRVCIACHPPEEAAKALMEAVELEKELNSIQIPPSLSGTADPDSAAEEAKDQCIGSMTGSAIFWNGDMQSCISMNGYNCVKPFETGFEAAWAQLKANEDRTFLKPAACRECAMGPDCLHNCAARRFEGTGSVLVPDPYICQYTHLMNIYKNRQ